MWGEKVKRIGKGGVWGRGGGGLNRKLLEEVGQNKRLVSTVEEGMGQKKKKQCTRTQT